MAKDKKKKKVPYGSIPRPGQWQYVTTKVLSTVEKTPDPQPALKSMIRRAIPPTALRTPGTALKSPPPRTLRKSPPSRERRFEDAAAAPVSFEDRIRAAVAEGASFTDLEAMMPTGDPIPKSTKHRGMRMAEEELAKKKSPKNILGGKLAKGPKVSRREFNSLLGENPVGSLVGTIIDPETGDFTRVGARMTRRASQEKLALAGDPDPDEALFGFGTGI